MATNHSSSKGSNGKKAKPGKVHNIKGLGIAVIEVVGGALYNPEVAATRPSLLSNPHETIDELNKLSPFWGDIATRVVCTTLGWYVVSALVWELRKANAAPKVTSHIDWLNDSLNMAKELAENEKNIEEQGLEKLAFVDGTQFIGAYKYLYLQIDKEANNNMELPTPAVLYARMQQMRDDQQTLAAYETFENERYKNSPTFKYIQERSELRRKQMEERNANRAQKEIDYVHEQLSAEPAIVLDDGTWNKLPLWARFKIMRSLYNQIMSAVVAEDEKPADERIHKEALVKMGEDLLLELQAADREPEVRLAFKQEVLKSQHALL